MIEFDAVEIGYFEEYDTISCGASNAGSSESYHCINFQRPIEVGGKDDDGIYFEIDDQINGGYNIVESCELKNSELVIKLVSHFKKMPGEIVVVTFSTMSTEGLRPFDEGLKRVFFGHEDKFINRYS